MNVLFDACCIVAALAAGQAEPEQLDRYEAAQPHMGVLYKIVLYAPDDATAERAADAAFARVAKLNEIMSDYDEESELSLLSQSSPTAQPIKVSDDLWRVLIRAQAFSERSGGAFDVTIGPVTRLWRKSRRTKELPSDVELTDVLAAVGYQHVQLDEQARTVSLARPNMQLDLGGIAKGYAADEALAAMRKHGVTRAIVDASGDIAIGDPPPDKSGWLIGVAALERNGPPSRILLLTNCAVATSGDAWQFVEIDGKRYSHIVNPRTGLGLTDRSSVTIVAPDCTTADALASAVSVLGPAKGIELVEQTCGAAALIVRAPNGETETHESRRFSKLTTQSSE